MKNNITELYLNEIINRYPEAIKVFEENGLGKYVNGDAAADVCSFLKLRTVIKSENLDENEFILKLKGSMEGIESDVKLSRESLDGNSRLNLLALLPCPVKFPLQEAFKQYVEEGKIPTDNLQYLIESNANNQLSYYQYVEHFEDEDEIPDIVISPGINSFYYKDFEEKFMDKGIFADVTEYMPNKIFDGINIKDPEQRYTIISMNLLVMVVDKLKIGNIPMPRKWGDLMNKEFENKVIIRGQKDFFCETTLITIYKQYGIEGIEKFAKSVKCGWHPSQMAKKAGSDSEDAPVVSVMPYFYTKTIKHRENVEIVWPEDGAIVSPITMLVKKEKAKDLKEFIDFFTGEHVGQIFSSTSFPSLHPDVDNKIPENAKLNWIGWDYIKQNDMGKLIKMVSDIMNKVKRNC